MKLSAEQITNFMVLYRTNDLKHYGVKGQRWGVRRTKAALARSARREGREVSPDAARAKALSKKKRSELTNDELRFLNERQNLEQNNQRLNPSAVARGRNKTLALLGTVGVVGNFVKSPAGKATISAGKIAVGSIMARSSLSLLPTDGLIPKV